MPKSAVLECFWALLRPGTTHSAKLKPSCCGGGNIVPNFSVLKSKFRILRKILRPPHSANPSGYYEPLTSSLTSHVQGNLHFNRLTLGCGRNSSTELRRQGNPALDVARQGTPPYRQFRCVLRRSHLGRVCEFVGNSEIKHNHANLSSLRYKFQPRHHQNFRNY